MIVETILNRCHRFKGFVYQSSGFEQRNGGLAIVVGVRPRKGIRGLCSGCGRQAGTYDHLPERAYGFIPLWGYPVFFRYAPRRVDCPDCGVKVERLPWSDGKYALTNAFRVFLATWAKRLSWQGVREAFHTSWEQVYRSVAYVVSYGLAHRSLEGIKSIGVDELQYRDGHKYLTLVYQLDEGMRRLLWIGKDRSAKTLLRFFQFFGKARTEYLQAVCTDMWRAYLRVIRKKIPQAVHVLDRFHLMANLNKAIDKVRREESTRMHTQGYEPILSKSRWCFLKRKENLTEKQGLKLKELLQYNLKTVKSYLLKKELLRFWTYKSPFWARLFLEQWITKTMRSRIEPMKGIARSFRQHLPLIVNWFVMKGKLSTAPVEAMNGLARLTMRKSCGFRSYKNLELALYHNLGDLPMPELTHKFC